MSIIRKIEHAGVVIDTSDIVNHPSLSGKILVCNECKRQIISLVFSKDGKSAYLRTRRGEEHSKSCHWEKGNSMPAQNQTKKQMKEFLIKKLNSGSDSNTNPHVGNGTNRRQTTRFVRTELRVSTKLKIGDEVAGIFFGKFNNIWKKSGNIDVFVSLFVNKNVGNLRLKIHKDDFPLISKNDSIALVFNKSKIYTSSSLYQQKGADIIISKGDILIIKT